MILVKTPEEIKIMAEGGERLAKIMKELEKRIEPGITTKELDKLSEELVLKYGDRCSFKGHEGFPACLCTSINEEIVHAVPSDRCLKEGDIISLDLGLFYKGFHSDMAVTVAVGKVASEVQKLIEATKESLKKGIEEAKAGNTFGDIGNAIQRCAEENGFNVVRELCGHGIGRELHEDPQILNYGRSGSGPKIKEGMVFCLEPMVTAGGWRIKKTKDGFGYKTADNSLSCHFEHMIAVTKNGVEILTMI